MSSHTVQLKKHSTLWPIFALLALFWAQAAQAQSVKVIELFTSHGCSSCPAAEELLGEFMSNRDDVLALEFHVDYWDTLVYGEDGSWVDPFSSPAFTERQRIYRARNIRGREGLYTPQAVINGDYVAVGSDKKRLVRELDNFAAHPLQVTLIQEDSQILVNIEPSQNRPWTDDEKQADVVLVRFHKRTQTEITSGENRYLTLVNHNVVTQIEPIATNAAGQYRVNRAQDANSGCAILIQSRDQGPILGAAYCP